MPSLESLQAAASEHAAALEADFVGTEHLFLAWLTLATGPAAEAVSTAGLTPDAFRELLASGKARRRGPAPVAEQGGLSSQAVRTIEAATALATQAGRTDAGEDDLLLAMIREPRGFVARALTAHSLKPSRLKALARGQAPEPEAQSAARPERPARPERKATPPVESDAPAQRRRERTAVPQLGGRSRFPDDDDPIPMPPAPPRPKPTPTPIERPVATPPPTKPRRFSVMTLLYVAIPVAMWMHWAGVDPLVTFAASCVGVLPLAGLMGKATEHLAERTGPTLGGLLNATFGNAAELIIAFAALRGAHVELVKASITGSILGNLLLILGLSLIAGGRRASLVTFNRTNAGMGSAMLALAVAGLVFPALFHATHPAAAQELYFSETVATILIVTYLFSLLFVLKTHKPLFGGGHGEGHGAGADTWSVKKAVGMLTAATVGVAIMSEVLVAAVEPVTQSLGISEAFLGLIVIPVIGNAAEHGTAVLAAARGKTDLALQIALGSSTQIALLVAPLLVFAGAAMGVTGMNLVFPPYEVVGLGIAVVTSAIITLDGESHWFEGVQLLALYGMFAAAAWFV
ncbi:MAG: calcium/proton exchanger [Gemmatimonadales bacterium]